MSTLLDRLSSKTQRHSLGFLEVNLNSRLPKCKMVMLLNKSDYEPFV